MQISGSGSSSLAQMLQEMQQKMQANFKSADSDSNGKLSNTEFAAFDQAMRAGAPQGTNAASGPAPSADEMFKKMDSDGDGYVTMEEIEANKPQMPQMSDSSLSAVMAFLGGDDNSSSLSGLLGEKSSSTSLADLFSGDDGSGGVDISSLIQQFLAQYQQTQRVAATTASSTDTGTDVVA